MPKYFCDYCDTYLTHDSPSVRKTHCSGRKHRENVKFYYQDLYETKIKPNEVVPPPQMAPLSIPPPMMASMSAPPPAIPPPGPQVMFRPPPPMANLNGTNFGARHGFL